MQKVNSLTHVEVIVSIRRAKIRQPRRTSSSLKAFWSGCIQRELGTTTVWGSASCIFSYFCDSLVIRNFVRFRCYLVEPFVFTTRQANEHAGHIMVSDHRHYKDETTKGCWAGQYGLAGLIRPHFS